MHTWPPPGGRTSGRRSCAPPARPGWAWLPGGRPRSGKLPRRPPAPWQPRRTRAPRPARWPQSPCRRLHSCEASAQLQHSSPHAAAEQGPLAGWMAAEPRWLHAQTRVKPQCSFSTALCTQGRGIRMPRLAACVHSRHTCIILGGGIGLQHQPHGRPVPRSDDDRAGRHAWLGRLVGGLRSRRAVNTGCRRTDCWLTVVSRFAQATTGDQPAVSLDHSQIGSRGPAAGFRAQGTRSNTPPASRPACGPCAAARREGRHLVRNRAELAGRLSVHWHRWVWAGCMQRGKAPGGRPR